MIHLESLIQLQKMSFFKRYLDPEYVADWKIVVDSLLMPVGGPYLLTPKGRTTATDVENYVTSFLLLFSV